MTSNVFALEASEDSRRAAHRLALRRLLETLPAVPEALISETTPDPFVLTNTEGVWLVATCNNRPYAFRVYHRPHGSARFEGALTQGGTPLALFPEGQLPPWWNQGEVVQTEPDLPADLLRARWAPEIFQLKGKLVLFYTARDREGLLRSAYATSDSIRGPWRDRGPLNVNPRAKQVSPEYPGGPSGPDPLLGTIDSTVASFEDRLTGKTRYALVCKVDGNALRWVDPISQQGRSAPTPLVAQEFTLEEDGALALVGEPNVIHHDGPHHDGLVEGQFFVQENGTLYVLYSAGFFGNRQYRTYVGKLDDVLRGRVRDERLLIDSSSPVLGSRWNGPGHPSLERIQEGLYALYLHVWPEGMDYEKDGDQRRALRLHLSFKDIDGRPCEPFLVEDLLLSEHSERLFATAL